MRASMSPRLSAPSLLRVQIPLELMEKLVTVFSIQVIYSCDSYGSHESKGTD